MGWDVVSIGLKHDLPVKDAHATAEIIATKMNRNIILGYWKSYEYNATNQSISRSKDHSFIQLARFVVNNSDEFLRMTSLIYQATQILQAIGIDKVRKQKSQGNFAKSLLEDIDNPYILYEIEDEDGILDICISQENVDLNVDFVNGRWNSFERFFHDADSYQQGQLKQFRSCLYERAQLFGCKEAIVCADQGPGQFIYDRINYSAARLLEYTSSYQYLNDYDREVIDREVSLKRQGKHIMFSSAFQGPLNLSDEDWIEVVLDDFADLSIHQ